MCGLAGLWRQSTAEENRETVALGVAAISHRGPDATGVWSSGEIGLAHARLSIIDLSVAANQPMHAESYPVTIVYNGELYNFRELRTQLIARGHIFKTRSDTEVILASYLEWGTAAFARFAGMFAIAIWDGRSKKLVLARDRVGIKPLYYCDTGDAFYFASEPKAILAMAPTLPRRLDPQAMQEFLWFGNALGERTMFSGIRRLTPGAYLTIEAGEKRQTRFWKAAEVPAQRIPYEEAVAGVRHALKQAVKSHLVSDVPVGVFLSGGIDSSAITAFAAEQLGSGLLTYSAAFDFQESNELRYARQMAALYGTRHEELRVDAPAARDLIPILIRCHDEPFSDAANIPLYLMAQILRHKAKVVLQGDGGDELFGGYQRYEWLRMSSRPWKLARRAARLLCSSKGAPQPLARALRVVDALGADGDARFALLLTNEAERFPPTDILSAEFRSALTVRDPFERYREVLSEVRSADPVATMLLVDLCILLPDTFLEKVDKATMAHGVEVRVPFLDNDLVQYTLGLPSEYKVKIGDKKRVLRAALRGVVPDEILDRPKAGFGVPYQEWLRGPLHAYLLDSVRDSRARRDGLVDFAAVSRLASQHAARIYEHGFLLWKTLNFVLWYDAYGLAA
jgi:asparagine synthase (glutamine-hydrolysing)